ncbi:hypothetical protein EYF80_016841 [Liparis tanakae]|uniref:Uncharacterized protein n=1 Tax=Liparis tanakae TaxID=230148 RepID=A0A4Z2I6J6_9TELE|nr:hypothetical protein EYF80_016841 [Liparis tanakae]
MAVRMAGEGGRKLAGMDLSRSFCIAPMNGSFKCSERNGKRERRLSITQIDLCMKTQRSLSTTVTLLPSWARTAAKAEPRTPAPTITTSGSGASGASGEQLAEAFGEAEDSGSILFLVLRLWKQTESLVTQRLKSKLNCTLNCTSGDHLISLETTSAMKEQGR